MHQIKYLFSALILLIFHPSFAQKTKIDSLTTRLTQTLHDTDRVNILNALGRELMFSNPDTAFLLSTRALEIAEKIKLNGTKLLSRGWEKGKSNSLGNLGICNYLKGNYPEALDYFLKALKIDEAINNKKGISVRLNNIGNVYFHEADYPKALEYNFRGLKIAEELGDNNGIAAKLVNIGIAYMEQSDYPKALDYYFRALSIKKELGDKNGIATILGNIGNVYNKQGEYPKAIYHYFGAMKMNEAIGNKYGITINLGNLGLLFTKTKKYREAGKYLQDALRLAKEIGALDGERHHEKGLSELYEKTNRHKEALEHYKRAMALKDTIFSQENKKQLVRKEMNFEFEKKEAIAKAEQEKKDAVAEEEKRKQKIITWSVSGGLVLILAIAIIILRSLNITRRQKKVIESQKTEVELQKTRVEDQKHIIEEKNKDITDSINYARRIQHAMLPHGKDIWNAFPQSFILFKPKDIVSGDFYFFHKNAHTAFIAACDCTGHGVPGAFMSLIGSDTLGDAVSQSADISEILSLLNNGVKIALKQSEEDEHSTRDGMDIALCSVDTVSRIVKYAGANRPLWIIRQGSTIVEEIKATKKAIGGFTGDNEHFDIHEIQFEKGDTFYISTDGFADTFGGSLQKKVTTKKFREILLSIQDKPLKEQGQHLENFIEEWKGGLEQVDDILVIGVRL